MKRAILAGAGVILVTALAVHPCASQSASAQAPATPPANSLTVPAGQKFILQLETSIHTNSTRKGDRVEFQLAGDVMADNQVAIPARSWVRATVTKSKRAGRLMGRAEVRLQFNEVRLADGATFPLRATILRVGYTALDGKNGQPALKGESGTAGNVGQVVAAAGQGALIGVISTGSLKGGMYGGAAGAAISAVGMILRRGPDLDLPRDTMLEARFDQPITIPVASVQRAELAQHAEAAAQVPAPEPQAGIPEADDSSRKTRPVLRRTHPAEPPPTETAPTPEETAGAQPTAEATPPPRPADVPPPPVSSSQPPVQPQAQSPDPGGFKLSVNVKMVLVDAVVRDRAGRIIDNLTREDFRVFEDGVEQQIRNFSRDALPLAVALVVDHSGSVMPYIDELRRIANRALQQLKPGDKVALFSFANHTERLVDLTTDRQRIADGIAHIRGGGSTDIIDALFDSVTYLARVAPDHRRAVILVSDNQPTVRPQASEGQTIRMAMETETVVYSLRTSGEAIPLGMRLPNVMMGTGSVQKVAQETGGEVINVAGVGMLDAALGSVVSRLRLRYSIGYYPSSQVQGGAFHSIEVRLVERLGKPGSDYFVHARRGYYATSDQLASEGRP
jgi:VWFA-related protein